MHHRQPRQSDQLSGPVIAFATSASGLNLALPGAALHTVLIDSDVFRSMMITCGVPSPADPAAETLQTVPWAILYSSGTTGHICEEWNLP
ncbi:hypothetical protein QJS10_CPA10g02062 [Acorus calamus]|uniref:Uncharacterized protein n=1 Tax=Acorus calamus TaxID=4465 RepID=A0AAV9DZX6_ACOCL|nr:hypothetical protein QJS10_CPA10g02062 [Acorus calamus]